MNPLVLPQVNLNGTSKQALVDQQCVVLSHLRAVYEAMSLAFPHGRDYQFRPEEYKLARAAWEERMHVIGTMRCEIEQHALAIHDGDGK